MNIACPECGTLYRVDPSRIPEGGTRARCRECGTIVRIDGDLPATAPGEQITAPRVESRAAASSQVGDETGASGEGVSGTGASAPVFGPQDPDTRARRLARALVSDIKVYNLEKWESATEAGTLRRDFRDEILKSWDEYVEQVGKEMAKKTPHFREALNDILAQGEGVF